MLMALVAYRHVLRSTRVAFQGDPRLLSAARVEARSRFNSYRSLPPDSTEVEHKILEAKEVARILKENIVQGQQVMGSGDDEQRYQLRIHDEIERGDNESIKQGSGLISSGEGCCGGAA